MSFVIAESTKYLLEIFEQKKQDLDSKNYPALHTKVEDLINGDIQYCENVCFPQSDLEI